MSKDTINIYWSPYFDLTEKDWTFLYPKPNTLFTDLGKNKAKDIGRSNIFSCPAVSEKMKNIYVFNNAMDCSYFYNGNDIHPTSENFLSAESLRNENIAGRSLFSFSLQYLFFADEPVDAYFTPPFFHEPQHTKYGSVLFGEFNIGEWFRPFNFEMQTWNSSGEIVFKDNEPLFYVEFKTDKKINLRMFSLNSQLNKYAESCVNVKNIFGRRKPLSDSYRRFNSVGLRDKILKEIQNNIVE